MTTRLVHTVIDREGPHVLFSRVEDDVEVTDNKRIISAMRRELRIKEHLNAEEADTASVQEPCSKRRRQTDK